MNGSALAKRIALSLGVHTLQTTPYVAIAGLLAKYTLLPVLGAVLILAAMLFCLLALTRAIIASEQVSLSSSSTPKRPVPFGLVATFAATSSTSWVAHMATIERLGANVGVAAILASGVLTMWLARIAFRTERHKGPNVTALGLASGLVVVALVIITRTHDRFNGLAHPVSGAGSYSYELVPVLIVPVLILLLGVAVSSVLRTILTDPEEATLRGHAPIRAWTIVGVEIISAALVATLLNIHLDGGATLYALLPASLDPRQWTRDHWILLWVGVVNTFIGVVWLTKLTNLIGVPLAAAVGQSRPVIAELLQVIFGMTAVTLTTLVDLSASCCLLFLAAHILSSRR